MECLGGNGYVEDSGMPRLYREAPLYGIWEGSGNVSALDTLRAMATAPKSVDALFDELDRADRTRRPLRPHLAGLKKQLSTAGEAERPPDRGIDLYCAARIIDAAARTSGRGGGVRRHATRW